MVTGNIRGQVKSVRLSAIFREKTHRLDAAYLLDESPAPDEGVKFKDLFEIIVPQAAKIPDDLLYCEIGHASSDGSIHPIRLVRGESEHDDAAPQERERTKKLWNKIERGDIIKPNLGDTLVPKVRVYLGKIILIDQRKTEVHFTSAFICLRPKGNPLLSHLLLKGALLKKLIALSRWGKAYPTLSAEDLAEIRLDENMAADFARREKELKADILEAEKLGEEIDSLEKTRREKIAKIARRLGEK